MPEDDRGPSWRGDDTDQNDADQTRRSGRLAGARTAIARRDLASLKREKTIVLALLIQLFVATFSSFLVVGLTAMYDPGSVDDASLAVGVTGDVQDDLATAASRQDSLRAIQFPDRAAAMQAFDDGRVQAVLDARRVSTDSGPRIEVQAFVPAERLQTTVVVVQLRRALSALEEQARQERQSNLEFRPLDAPDRVDASPYFGFTYTILVPLLVFLPPFISGSVVVDSVTEEIERGTLELLRVAPVSLSHIVDGKAAGMILLAPAQVVLWLGLLWVNGIAVSNPLALLVFVTAITTVVVLLGVLLSLVTRRRRQAQLAYSTLVLLLFGFAILLPEHPATTVAKLAVESATVTTYVHVGLFVAIALGATVLVRRFVGYVDPESLG